jgi:hypothetical protein
MDRLRGLALNAVKAVSDHHPGLKLLSFELERWRRTRLVAGRRASGWSRGVEIQTKPSAVMRP